jgi:hypothetical protein
MAEAVSGQAMEVNESITTSVRAGYGSERINHYFSKGTLIT